MTPRLDSNRAEAGHELEEMLGLDGHEPVFEDDHGHFKTYPNVLNNFGCSNCDAEIPEEAESEALFRDLPNDGERSPRSRLACSMVKRGLMPNVLGLSQAECFTNTELAEKFAKDEWMNGYDVNGYVMIGMILVGMIWATIMMTCGDCLMCCRNVKKKSACL
jgi:hypothetical protein